MANEIPSGPALDAEVERRLFGGDMIQCPRNGIWGYRWMDTEDVIDTRAIPGYSYSMGAAMQIVNKLADRYPTLMIEGLDQEWRDVTFMSPLGEEHRESLSGSGRTVMEAICRAALKSADQE